MRSCRKIHQEQPVLRTLHPHDHTLRSGHCPAWSQCMMYSQQSVSGRQMRFSAGPVHSSRTHVVDHHEMMQKHSAGRSLESSLNIIPDDAWSTPMSISQLSNGHRAFSQIVHGVSRVSNVIILPLTAGTLKSRPRWGTTCRGCEVVHKRSSCFGVPMNESAQRESHA